MKRSTMITTAEHSLLCNESYLEYLKKRITQSDYIIVINSHTQLATDRLYNSLERRSILLEEYNEAKAIVTRVHNSYLKKGAIHA